MSTKIKPAAADISAAIAAIPSFGSAANYAAPPVPLVPEDLLPLRDELVDALEIVQAKEQAYTVAKAHVRSARDDYRAAVAREATGGPPAVDEEQQRRSAETHARAVLKSAQGNAAAAHRRLTAACRERADEILATLEPDRGKATADAAEATAALAAARSTLSAVAGIRQWLTADFDSTKRAKAPFRA